MGKKIVVVAALLATSVIEVTIRQVMVTVAKGGRLPKGVSNSATQVDKPEICWVKNKEKTSERQNVSESVLTRYS